MKEVISEGKSLDEATENGLQLLNATREEVEVEPLDTGTNGFLGLGRKPAQVKISLRPDDRIRTQVFLRNVLSFMNIETQIEISEDQENINIVLGEEASVLIGHRGQTLDALQYLIARFLNEDREEWRKVVLDIDHYRDRRDESLRSMAQRMADQVVRNRRDMRTEPLSAPERRIIHMALKENSAVTTFSIGDGSRKRVVITSSERRNYRRGGRGRGSGGGRGNSPGTRGNYAGNRGGSSSNRGGNSGRGGPGGGGRRGGGRRRSSAAKPRDGGGRSS